MVGREVEAANSKETSPPQNEHFVSHYHYSRPFSKLVSVVTVNISLLPNQIVQMEPSQAIVLPDVFFIISLENVRHKCNIWIHHVALADKRMF